MTSAGMPYGLQAMLKDGYTHVSGMNEAVYRNLEACKELSKVTRTSMGPNGTCLLKSCLIVDNRCPERFTIELIVSICRHEQDCHQPFGQNLRHQ